MMHALFQRHYALAFALPILCFIFSSSVLSAQTAPKPVSVTPLKTLLFYPVREAPATVVSLNNSLISAEISGRIEAILVQSGTPVKKGDVIAKIDCTPYLIAQKRATAALNAGYARNRYAKKRFDDAKKLRKRNVLTLDEYNLRSSEANEAASNVGVLSADLKEAQRRVSKCHVTAPFDAIVIARIASIGDYATPGTPLVRLLDNHNLEVSAKIQQQDLDSLKQAGSYQFIVAKNRYPVTLRTLIPLVESRIRSFEARLSFTDKTAPSGSAGRLQWQSKHAHIPADFLIRRDNKIGVFIVTDNIAHFHLLPDAKSGLPAAIQLPPDTPVITTGRYSLVEGQPVKIVAP